MADSESMNETHINCVRAEPAELCVQIFIEVYWIGYTESYFLV